MNPNENPTVQFDSNDVSFPEKYVTLITSSSDLAKLWRKESKKKNHFDRTIMSDPNTKFKIFIQIWGNLAAFWLLQDHKTHTMFDPKKTSWIFILRRELYLLRYLNFEPSSLFNNFCLTNFRICIFENDRNKKNELCFLQLR
jgi:hypothetical protein